MFSQNNDQENRPRDHHSPDHFFAHHIVILIVSDAKLCIYSDNAKCLARIMIRRTVPTINDIAKRFVRKMIRRTVPALNRPRDQSPRLSDQCLQSPWSNRLFITNVFPSVKPCPYFVSKKTSHCFCNNVFRI